VGEAGHGFGQDTELEVDGGGEFVDLLGVDFAVRGEAAVPPDAVGDVDGSDLAQVVSSGGAGMAAVAGTVGVDGHLVALLEVGHLAADLGDGARELVANCEGLRTARELSLDRRQITCCIGADL